MAEALGYERAVCSVGKVRGMWDKKLSGPRVAYSPPPYSPPPWPCGHLSGVREKSLLLLPHLPSFMSSLTYAGIFLHAVTWAVHGS